MDERYLLMRNRLAHQIEFLPDKPEESADVTARALWYFAAGEARSAVSAIDGELPVLESAGIERFEELGERRLRGEPLAHITGRQHFLGIDFLAGPAALVPRIETELLARAAIDCIRQIGRDAGQTLEVLDVCTGSGNVALAIAHHVPDARVSAADLDADAVALARRNATHLALESRVEFRCGDLIAPFDTTEFEQHFDLLTCNPPYISSAKAAVMSNEISDYEPRMAFDGGPLGVNILMRLIDEAPRLLKIGGWLAFEVGLGQGPAMVRRLEKHDSYTEVRGLKNEQGAIRTVLAQRRAESAQGKANHDQT